MSLQAFCLQCSLLLALVWRVAGFLGAAPTAGLYPATLPSRSESPSSRGFLRMLERLHDKPRAVTNSLGVFRGRFETVQATRADLDDAAALCISVFFGEPDSPWKATQLQQLLLEQRADLASRCMRNSQNFMFKTVDTRYDNRMVGFVEISAVPGSRYGMGAGVPEADLRPVVANLAVEPRTRRCGIGSSLMGVCEDAARAWGFNELTLQVEEDNYSARAFYERAGFDPLFVDRAARKYDTSGFLLQNVRCSKVMLRKALPYVAPVPQQAAPTPPRAQSSFWGRSRPRRGSGRIASALRSVFNFSF